MGTAALARVLCAEIEARAAQVHGTSRAAVRPIVARAARISPGSWERIVKGRRKKAGEELAALARVRVLQLQDQLLELEHKLQVTRLLAERPDVSAIFAVEAQISEARERLRSIDRGGAMPAP